MTAQPVERFDHPAVELQIDRSLLPEEVSVVTATNATAKPEESIEKAVLGFVGFATSHLRDEMASARAINPAWIRSVLDTAWQLYVPFFQRATGPMIAEAYIKAFRDVQEERVPAKLIYQLADEHANRIGAYFNETSSEALVQGFNTYVNRKVPQKAALERVADAYGLTPRQMSGFTSAVALQPQEVKSGIAQNLKRKIKAYVGESLARRLKIFVGQEAHNLDMQAKQVAWMWQLQHGELAPNAQKMWLTAKDEKVCPICAPLHGVKVDVNDRFELNNGAALYVPGAHVNCRCEVRLMEVPLELVGKAERFDARKHPRGARGRFRDVPDQPTAVLRPVDPDVARFLRESQEERERVVEEAAEKAGVKLTEEAPSRGVSLGAHSEGVRLGGVKLGGVSLGNKVQLDDVKPSLSRTDQKIAIEEPLVSLSGEQQNAMAVKLGEAFARAKPKRPTRPTVTDEIFQTVALPHPGYIILEDYQFDEDGRVQLSEDDNVRVSKENERNTIMFEYVLDKFAELQKDEARRIMGKNKDFAVIKQYDARRGGTITAEVPIEYIYTAIDASVNTRAKWTKVRSVPLTWVDRDGKTVYHEDEERPMGQADAGNIYVKSPAMLAKMLKVRPSNLVVKVGKIYEGYEDTWNESKGTTHGEEIWRTPGTFATEKAGFEVLDSGTAWRLATEEETKIPTETVVLKPEADPDFFITRDMTDEEWDKEKRERGWEE